MIQRLLSSIAMAGLLAGPALAEPITLGEAVSRAVVYDPAIAQAEAGVDQTRAGVDAARAQRGLLAVPGEEFSRTELELLEEYVAGECFVTCMSFGQQPLVQDVHDR